VRLESGPWRGRAIKKARLTEEQIIGILHKHEAGAKCADLCRKHGMSEGTFYAWKAKYSGMTVSKGSVLGWMKDQWQVRQVTTTIA
jgi:putative transposase